MKDARQRKRLADWQRSSSVNLYPEAMNYIATIEHKDKKTCANKFRKAWGGTKPEKFFRFLQI